MHNNVELTYFNYNYYMLIAFLEVLDYLKCLICMLTVNSF